MPPRFVPSTLIGVAIACVLAGFDMDGPLRAQSQWDGVYTVEQAGRGGVLYGDQCASCHGEELEGRERAPGLAGEEFSFNWNGATLRELFELIHNSMPQNDPGSLSPAQNADILAYMLQKGEFPAGQTELPADPELLDTMRFDATKP